MTHYLSALIWLLVDDDVYYDMFYIAELASATYSVCHRTMQNFIAYYENDTDAQLLALAHSYGYRLTHVTDPNSLLGALYYHAKL